MHGTGEKGDLNVDEQQNIAKAGKLLCVDRGAYSEYEVTGFFVVLRDFDPHTELDEYLDAHADQRDEYNFEPDGYLAALLAKGLLIEIDYGTLHLGNVSGHDRFRFTPAHGG